MAKKLKPILMRIVEQTAIVNRANSSIVIRSDLSNTSIRNHVESEPYSDSP